MENEEKDENESLLKHSLIKFLEKIGEGNATPGAGTAAATVGVLAAQLSRTVGIISEKRIEDLKEKLWFGQQKTRLDTEYIPRLVKLLEEDTDVFDEVIFHWKWMKKEAEIVKKSEHKINMLEKLKESIHIPLEIGDLCAQVNEIAIELFDRGYHEVRGDSSVSLQSALATLASCISIVDLNFIKVECDETTIGMMDRRNELKVRLNRLDVEVRKRFESLETESQLAFNLKREFQVITDAVSDKKERSTRYIESFADRVRKMVWEYRSIIWNGADITDPMEALEAEDIIQHGFDYLYTNSDDAVKEALDFKVSGVAGFVDQNKKFVYISRNYPIVVRRFTAAHELGHLIFHKGLTLHRDFSLNGNFQQRKNDIKETEANKFASYFLIPSDFLIDAFRVRFGDAIFDHTLKSLEGLNVRDGRKLRSRRERSKFVASAKYYWGKRFTSLADAFNVSVVAMAIRLEDQKFVL